MKPNFKDINIKSTEKATTTATEWEKANHIEKNWLTPELIPVKPVYTAEAVSYTHLDVYKRQLVSRCIKSNPIR